MLGSLFAVVVSLTNSPVKPVEPEVVVGGLICLGEAWKLSVTRPQCAWSLPRTHCWQNSEPTRWLGRRSKHP